ncbi:diacylglycerol O-acyltransferase 1 [Sticta canariensis]|nr:diacylglycerol O-acyltransferase 1 [Sticta canariensis]
MASATLNAESSLSREREKNQLPSESYANAVEQNPNLGSSNEQIPPAQYTGQGEDDTPRSPRKKTHKKSGSLRMNGHQPPKRKETSIVVVEDFQDKDGEHLTGLKRNDTIELVSGRKAGAGWEKSHIHFAPLSIPLKRRLQTLLVLAHTLSVAGLLTIFFLLCAIPLFWPILVPYLLYVILSAAPHSGNLSHRSDFLRSLKIWSLFASYFPARLHRSAELPSTRKYVFGYHPHGIISHGAFAAFATEALGFSKLFPGITNTLLTLDNNFRVPLYRDYALAMGLASVSRESCENILSRGGPNKEGMGRAITIVVGGARESLDAQPHSLRLVLKRRKGFIKLAIRTGADLVPVLAFGENELYDQVQSEQHPLIHRMQLVVKKVMGFTIPLFHARGVFNYDMGLMPYRRPLNIVVGKPIKVVQQGKPDDAYVDTIHALYVSELERIWQEWKDQFAMERTSELEIVE